MISLLVTNNLPEFLEKEGQGITLFGIHSYSPRGVVSQILSQILWLGVDIKIIDKQKFSKLQEGNKHVQVFVKRSNTTRRIQSQIEEMRMKAMCVPTRPFFR